VIRQVVRRVAAKILRSDDLDPGEKEIAAGILRANPAFGNPHAVRCDWCHESRTLFRDENEVPFELADGGWRCVTCDERAACQEIKF
jgi:DNA gyrase inhibitor GyrI